MHKTCVNCESIFVVHLHYSVSIINNDHRCINSLVHLSSPSCTKIVGAFIGNIGRRTASSRQGTDNSLPMTEEYKVGQVLKL